MSFETIYQRLLAEAETWPLASESGFRSRLIHLGRVGICTLDDATHELAEVLESHLRTRSGGMSLGNLERLRDGAWFGQQTPEGPGRLSLADYIARLAGRYLELQGTDVVLRREGMRSRSVALGHWRWLSLRLPTDLLVSVLAASSPDDPRSDYVMLQPVELQDVLRRSVAETHLHANAGFGFPLLWTTWSRGFSEKTPELSLVGLHEVPFGSSHEFVRMLTRAFLARLLLGRFLAHVASGARETFGQFLFEGTLSALCETAAWEKSKSELLRLCRAGLNPLLPKDMFEEWGESQTDENRNEFQTSAEWRGPQTETIREAYRALIETHNGKPSTQGDAIAADPLNKWFRRGKGALPETQFACQALRYLLGSGDGDTVFATVFWQYQRIRCMAFRFLVEEAGTAGLDWFQRHFTRLDSLRNPLAPLLYDATFESTRRGLMLRALELRLQPRVSATRMREELITVLGSSMRWECAPDERPEVGLVYHFIKERHPKKQRDKPHADPAIGVFRFADWFKSRRKEAGWIEDLLKRFPSSLLVVRGIDVASSELAVPTWATVELLTHLRRESFRTVRKIRRRWAGWRLRPLRVTYHVGEEYQRLVEGVRRIHELIQFRILRRRDRIGHGLALGADVADWIRDAPVAFQPAEDRLDDLLWELERYICGDIEAPVGRREFIEQSIRRLAGEIYGGSPLLITLLKARRLRHLPEALNWLGFPTELQSRKELTASYLLLRRYLTESDVYRRGQRLVEVLAGENGEQEFLMKAQAWVKSRIVKLGITIEVNPTSNLLIANLHGMAKHPLLGLTKEPDAPKFSINSDDPLTFATTLCDEYSYLYGELERRDSSRARDRIDAFREYGWRSRFTLEASRSHSNLSSLRDELNKK